MTKVVLLHCCVQKVGTTCALAPRWLSAFREKMLWRGCWTCWAKRTLQCGWPVMVRPTYKLLWSLPCILVHFQEQDCHVSITFKMSVTSVTGSGSYQQAIMDVRRFFPEGLCCTETNTMRQEQVCLLNTGHGKPDFKAILCWVQGL